MDAVQSFTNVPQPGKTVAIKSCTDTKSAFMCSFYRLQLLNVKRDL